MIKPFPVKVIPGGVAEPIAALNKIKILENHEPLADIRTACPAVTLPADAGSETGMQTYLRQTVAEMLNDAAKKLPKEYRLHAVSTLRSFKRQVEIWRAHYERSKKAHPDWPENLLRKAANQYAAPVDQTAPPGHCTGGAVDVVLQKLDGSFIDIVPPDLTDWSLGHTRTTKVDPGVYESRMVLLQTMLGVGFSNCRDEYWHYSYGDSGWAVRVGEKNCCYGIVELPEKTK